MAVASDAGERGEGDGREAGRPARRRRRDQRGRHRPRRRRPRPARSPVPRRTTSPQGTSSRSGKYIHGGLRYLEYYEFRLVREALIEREVLLARGPAHHLADALRPAAQPRAAPGLADPAGPLPLRPPGRPQAPAADPRPRPAARPPRASQSGARVRKGFEYSDCWVDDARLVLLNALDAAERGATVLTRTAVRRVPAAGWRLGGRALRRPARRPAAGRCGRAASSTPPAPGSSRCWAGPGQSTAGGGSAWSRAATSSRRKFWDGHASATLLQNTDKRLIFVNP